MEKDEVIKKLREMFPHSFVGISFYEFHWPEGKSGVDYVVAGGDLPLCAGKTWEEALEAIRAVVKKKEEEREEERE